MSSSCYKKYSQFYVSVDCVIFGFFNGGLELLLLKRNIEPAKGQWSLPGGFMKTDESAEHAASRILNKLTGIDNLFMEQVRLFSSVDRDPGDRVISVVYYALVNPADYNKNINSSYNSYWVGLNDLPDLIFDHMEMVKESLKKLRKKAETEPVGFNLLPDKFTLPQLQSLYEAVFGKNFDKRNFRKKILSMNFLEKLDEKDKSTSKKGAYLYTFNKEMYDNAVKEGLSFAI